MRRTAKRLIYGTLIALMLVSTFKVQAAPADPFTGTMPQFDAAPAEKTIYNLGDWGVSEQRAVATYTYPINVPPGRNNMTPALALRYSSRSALHGGLAVGWTMDIPSISVDRSRGYEETPTYKASLGAVAGRLVEVPDVSPFGGQAYRVEFDDSYTRFFHLASIGQSSIWIAMTSDGVTHYFGDERFAGDGLTRWPLTKQADHFNNMVRYSWSRVTSGHYIEYSLQRIEYTSNQPAGLQAHAKVDFSYALDTCSNTEMPIGATPSASDPLSIEGGQRLTTIAVSVRDTPGGAWRLSKQMQLTYELRASILHNPIIAPDPPPSGIYCTQAPLRYLTKLQTTAYAPNGSATTLPPITYAYNRRVGNGIVPPPLIEKALASPGYSHYGTQKGAMGALLDLDSDGLRDRAWVIDMNDLCQLAWQRGLSGGTFEATVHQSSLPMAPWHQPRLPDERCTFNGQIAFRDRQIIFNGQLATVMEKGIVSYHFMDYTGDGRMDLLTNIWAAVDPASYVPTDMLATPVNAALSLATTTTPPPIPPLPMVPEGVWRVYVNAAGPGSSFAGPTDLFSKLPLKVQPPTIPRFRPFPPTLPPSVSDELLDTASLPGASIPTLTDLDGDGFLDFIDVGTHPNLMGTGTVNWTVYFGHGGSSFGPAYAWRIPELSLARGGRGDNEEIIDVSGARHIRKTTVAALHDMNGDGLSDLVVQSADTHLKMYLNTGKGFDSAPIDLGLSSPLEEVQTDYAYSASTVIDGNRGYRRRLIDVDSDGLVDMVYFPGHDNDITTPQQPIVNFNAGAHFLPSVKLPDRWTDLKHLTHFENGSWQVISDFTDGTGDGQADLLRWSAATSLKLIDSPGLSYASDLLKSVDNGRGLRIEYSYLPSTDATVMSWQHQANGLSSFYLPYPIWATSAVTLFGGFDTPKMVTRYSYTDPIFVALSDNADKPETNHFLGLSGTAVTELATGTVPTQRTTRNYGYFGGASALLLTQEWVDRAEGELFHPYTYKELTWSQEPLFDGQISVTLPRSTVMRTCLSDATTATCQQQTDNVYRTETTWTPVAPTNVASGVVCNTSTAATPQLYVQTMSQESGGLTPGILDRRTRYCYQVRYGQGSFATDDYRLLRTQSVDEEANLDASGLSFQPHGRTDVIYGASSGLPLRTDVNVDASTIASTQRTFDSATGNLLSITKPNQAASGGSGNQMIITYDAHMLFVQTVRNEIGHVITTTHDMATGVLLERSGPNFAARPGGDLAFERESWQIDGFGRVQTHSVPFDDAAQIYTLQAIDHFTYFDSELPNRVRTEHLRDVGGTVFVTSDRVNDGLGRVLTETQFIDANLSAITSYTYDGSGNLSTIDVPDPRVDSGAQVRFRYAYDGLNRLTEFTQPDGNGSSITYAGLEKTVKEVTRDGSGSIQKQVYDVFGRLIEVSEDEPPAQSAVTHYRYDLHDNLIGITDAEGNQTDLVHDWANHRVAITRGDRTWRYLYDLNDNLIQTISPIPVGEDPALHTVAYLYDDLDRITQLQFADGKKTTVIGSADNKVFLPLIAGGTQAASANDSLPGTSVSTQTTDRQMATIQYIYDTGPNGIGRLSQVELPFGKVEYTYAARGLLAAEQRSIVIADVAMLNVTQRVERTYNALGELELSRWDDGQQWRISYDPRGLVATVEWFAPTTNTWQKVADYARSVVGQPRVRNSSFGQVRQFAYDALGRVTQDTITSIGASGPVSTRVYGYTDSGDLANVAGATNGVSAAATYTYDAQHRLTTASASNGYAGAFTYSPTGNLVTANVTWNGSPETRQVGYEYGARDPQAVDRLVNLADGSTYADFAYDLSGNMIVRNAPNAKLLPQWNGLDQIRVVEGAHGAESYYYDHTGARMLAINANEDVRLWFGESETHFTLDGTQTKRYLHPTDGGSTLARIENSSQIELQYSDTLQNLMLTLNAQGNTIASFLYGPFGEIVQATGTDDHRRQFNGKETDAVSGLRYYGFRYYDPLTLRWNSADPLYRFVPDLGLRAPQRMNLYAFSLNNPVRYYDPDGREGKDTDSCQAPECGDGTVEEGSSCQEDQDGVCTAETATEDDTQNTGCNASSSSCVADEKARLEKQQSSIHNKINFAKFIIDLKQEIIQDLHDTLSNGKSPSISDRVIGVRKGVLGEIKLIKSVIQCEATGAECVGAVSGGYKMYKGFDQAINDKPLSDAEGQHSRNRINHYQQEIKAIRATLLQLHHDLQSTRSAISALPE